MMKNNFLKKHLLIGGLILGSAGAWSQVTTFDYTGAVDSYTVPAGITSISIQAYGAQGGNDNGGLGAGIYGEFEVTPGDVLNISVGQQGVVNNCGGPDASGGGGGGSFVWDADDAVLPFVAAGAGGGGNENWAGDCTDGLPGQAGEDGTSGAEGEAAGGTGGNGGAGDAPSGTGSGGGGWLTAGQNSTWGDGCTGGITVPTFIGGNGASGFGPGGEGGFGGGGGAVCGCGGGGGYSGGAGGNGGTCRAGGGGGGSYNQGAAQDNETGVRMGDGQIIITELCEALDVDVSDEAICLGESFTLDGTGYGTITWDGGVVNAEPFTPDAVGTYTYTSTSDSDDDCGFSIDITVYDALEITYTTVAEDAGSDGAINVTVTGGNPAYVFDWDNDGTGDFDDTEDLTGLIAGDYVVVVMCDAGCTATETVVLGNLAGIEEVNGLQVVVYPNPATGFVTISLDGTFNYQLSTINGDLVLKGNGFNAEEIALDELAKGMYMLNIFAGDQSTVIKLVKE
ncbi:MAG: T9SS type A sorting domain-containing protein [Crocinitomix sp.]|nr:T9SS type A sorting domain-containing protein [Crocinitomix sp.]